MSLILIAVIMGVVEGLTEFLPISSTGHLILVNHFLTLPDHLGVMFTVVIQLGAILSVVIYFRRMLFPHGNPNRRQVWELWKKILVAVLPAIAIGGIIGEQIQNTLFKPLIVAVALVAGGVVLILLETIHRKPRVEEISGLTYRTALAIGLIQCMAMVPGISRSAATIIGAMALGCSRIIAAEFSFFLAIPTMFAASSYAVVTSGDDLSVNDWGILLVGFLTSFVVAYLAIAFLMHYIKNKDFKLFGYYRILLGGFVIWYFSRN